MNNLQIIFDPDFANDLKPKIKSVLKQVKWLFPLWMQKVTVSWDARENEKTAELHLFKDYRQCQMVIFPIFMNDSESEQIETIVHEIIHCFNIPLKTACLEAIEDAAPEIDEKLKSVLERQVNSVLEQVTQDFTFVICGKMSEKSLQTT